jgi:hypothetical protein
LVTSTAERWLPPSRWAGASLAEILADAYPYPFNMMG